MTGAVQVCTHADCTEKPVARRLCPAHYQTAWKAGELRAHEKLPPRLKDPKICPTDHRHGESGTCYVHHQCRCEDCVSSQSRRNYRRLQLKAYGRYDTGLVDVAPVREHMLMLGEYGIGYKRVAALAGIGITPARNILWGRQDPGPRKGEMLKRVKRETAEAVLKVKPDIANLAKGQSIPSTGTLRRLQALVVAGWSLSKLGAQLGIGATNMPSLMQRDRVQVKTHMEVVELFDRLWNVEPPHEEWRDKIAYARTLKFAKARRWLPALAWDDLDTDVEPPAIEGGEDTIDEMAVELAIEGERVRLTPAERRECVARLHASRWSDARIAERIGCTDKTVFRIRGELCLEAFAQFELRERGAA